VGDLGIEVYAGLGGMGGAHVLSLCLRWHLVFT
jgi:hypothetical protein